jgi:hypothetical protein
MAYLLLSGLLQKRESRPFLATLGLFLLCYAGLGIGVYPYIVPHSITIWEAAAPHISQGLLLAGGILLVPLSLAATVFFGIPKRARLELGASELRVHQRGATQQSMARPVRAEVGWAQESQRAPARVYIQTPGHTITWGRYVAAEARRQASWVAAFLTAQGVEITTRDAEVERTTLRTSQ